MDTVIFDIEASCEDRAINSHYNMETIEIGAVKIRQGKVIDKFSMFVKPAYVEKLTPFCTELTGITFEDLKDAQDFSKVILHFYDFIYDCEIYSCGEFDRKFLVRELRDKGVTYSHRLAENAINSTHTDLKRLFTQVTGLKKKGMIGMANDLNITLSGKHHRAISDAENLGNIYLELERLRENKLKKSFTDNIMIELIDKLNQEHYMLYNLEKTEDTYISTCKSTGETLSFSFLEFIDTWSDTILTDMSERKLNYLGKQELKTLKHYSKLS